MDQRSRNRFKEHDLVMVGGQPNRFHPNHFLAECTKEHDTNCNWKGWVMTNKPRGDSE